MSVLLAQCGANEVESEEKLDTPPDQYDKAWKRMKGCGRGLPEGTQGSGHFIP